MIYLLDTDHVSLDQRGHPSVSERARSAGPTNLAISVITVEEQMRGWLAVIHNARMPNSRVTAYWRLRMAVEYFASVTLLDYTEEADALVAGFRRSGVRVGTAELRIAAVALVHGVTLVTRNARDFRQIPNLIIADWSVPIAPQ